MSLGIYTGGTTDGTDGTIISSSNKGTFTALSPSYITVHVRTDTADTYTNDQVFTIPTGVEVSFDGGSTWKGVADSPYTYSSVIGDLNQSIRLRQTAIQLSSVAALVTSGTFSSCTALGDVTGFTATSGNTQVSLSWSAVSNATSYTIDRSTDNSTWTNAVLSTNSTSVVDTGRTNGQIYYYRIKAVGTGQYKNSANYATANATPSNVIFSDSFASLDTTTNWIAVTSGSATVAASGGKAVITKNSTSNKAHLIAKANPLTHGGTWTVTALVDLSNNGSADYQHPVLALARKSSAPTSGDTFADVYFPLRVELYHYSVDNHNYFRFKFIGTDTDARWYDFGSAAWSKTFDGATDGSGSWIKLPTDTAQYQYIIEANATNGVRFIVKSADGATTYGTSAYTAWASIIGSGDYYIAFGAWQYDFSSAFSGVINVDSVTVTG